MSNLYLVKQCLDKYYDTYDSFIICCNTENEARIAYLDLKENQLYHKYGIIPDRDTSGFTMQCRMEEIKVQYLGLASNTIPYGIILALHEKDDRDYYEKQLQP